MIHNLRADTVTIRGHDDDEIEAYLAVPTDLATHGSIVVIHHLPGYDETTKEITRRFAAHGYAALMPNLYHREAPGADPDDAAAAALAGPSKELAAAFARLAHSLVDGLPIA